MPATQPNATPSLTRVASVKIERTLGRGAMGEVYQGVDEALGRPVAVKVLTLPQDPDAAARFDREAQALARLQHPHVVGVFHKGEVDGRPYFVMELVEGPSVQALLDAHGAMAVGEALSIIRQAAMGLAAAEEAGVVHRDIKPANLLVARDGTVKVADFGVCKVTGAGPGVTMEGTTLGTPFYMAPEQARGEPVDARADQYSLGATLYHLIAGSPPYPGTQTVAQLLAHQKSPVPDIRKVVPSVPPGVAELLRQMMAKDPSSRFGSYQDLVDALEEAELAALQAGTAPPATRPWRWVAAAGALVTAAGMTAWVLMPGQQPPAPATSPPSVPVAVAAAAAPEPLAFAPPPTIAGEAVAEQSSSGAEPSPSPEDLRADRATLLIDRVTGPPGADRAAAMTALARSGHPGARPSLERVVTTLEDPDAPLAAVLLGELGDQAATDALIKALHSPRRATVLAAVDALSALRDVRAVEPLKALAQSHPDSTVRTRAQRAGTLLFGVE